MKRIPYYLLANLLVFMPLSAAPFTDNGNGTVTDNKTGLIWQKCSYGQTYSGGTCIGSATLVTWVNALAYCENLNFASRQDWRLPSMNELLSIVDKNKRNPAIDTSVFPATVAITYWSSTTYMADTSYAWLVNFEVRRKTAPDFLVENMIWMIKQFLNPAPKNARRPWRAEEKRGFNGIKKI